MTPNALHQPGNRLAAGEFHAAVATADQMKAADACCMSETWDGDHRSRAKSVNEYCGVQWGAC